MPRGACPAAESKRLCDNRLVDEQTLEVYRTHAKEFADRDAKVGSSIARYFQLAFPVHGATAPRILDVGAGSGRELATLVAERFDALGVEPVEALRHEAQVRHPGLESRIVAGALPGLGAAIEGSFDGLVCSAVLQHVPRQRLFDAVIDLR